MKSIDNKAFRVLNSCSHRGTIGILRVVVDDKRLCEHFFDKNRMKK